MALTPLHKLADDLLFGMMSECPDLAAHMGVRDVAGRRVPGDTVTDYSPAGAARRDAVMETASRALTKIDRSALSPDEQTTYDVIDYTVNEGFFWIYRGRAGRDFPEMHYPVNALIGVHPTLVELFVENHIFAAPDDAHAYLARLRALPAAIAQAREVLAVRKAEGIVAPAELLAGAIEDLRAFVSTRSSVPPLIATLVFGLEKVGITGAQSTAMLIEAERCLNTEIHPAYAALIADAEKQSGENRPYVGLWSLPRGEEHYDWLLRAHTTTPLTPDEVHRRGKEELAALTARIIEKFDAIGFRGGSIGEMFQRLAEERGGMYPDSAEGRSAALADVERTLDTMTHKLGPLFDKLPRARFRVEPVPLLLEDSSHSRYTPPAADGSRPGTFILNLKEFTQRSRYELPTLCYHEVMPGHHVQLALAQELTQLPAFRRTIVFNAYIEGWAKYAETVPESAGAETDPRVALCRMKGELYSTLNLVLDTGIHAKRWTKQQAKSFFCEATGVPDAFAEMIVTRSLVNPGQLTSYKIGMLKMFELKQRLTQARGTNFRIQEFHDLVLRNGALPLSLLDRQVQAAIAA